MDVLYRCIKFPSFGVAELYLGVPCEKCKPILAGDCVGIEEVLDLLNMLAKKCKVELSVKDDVIIIYARDGHDLDCAFMRTALYIGFAHKVRSKRGLVDFVMNVNELELLFWYSRLTEFYEREGDSGVRRVAQAFKTLYDI